MLATVAQVSDVAITPLVYVFCFANDSNYSIKIQTNNSKRCCICWCYHYFLVLCDLHSQLTCKNYSLNHPRRKIIFTSMLLLKWHFFHCGWFCSYIKQVIFIWNRPFDFFMVKRFISWNMWQQRVRKLHLFS